jgi:hypothetical protein
VAADPAAAAPRPQSAPAGGGGALTRKLGPLPVWGWLAIIGVGGGALWYFIKSRESSSASSAGSNPAAVGGECADASGNSVPCDQVDYGGQIATLQAEIEALQGGGSGTSTGTTPVTGTTPNQPTPGPVTDLTVDVISGTLVHVSWRPPQFASHAATSTTYSIKVTPKDKAAHNIGSRTSYAVGGLKKGTSYTVEVTPSGGPSTSKQFKTKG